LDANAIAGEEIKEIGAIFFNLSNNDRGSACSVLSNNLAESLIFLASLDVKISVRYEFSGRPVKDSCKFIRAEFNS
jgi:hypothetical protein